jgi:hypothetical protein
MQAERRAIVEEHTKPCARFAFVSALDEEFSRKSRVRAFATTERRMQKASA